MIICRTCLEYKEVEQFYFRKSGRLCSPDCRDCLKLAQKIYYQNNRDKVLYAHQKYKKDNPEQVRETNLQYSEANREKIREYSKRYRQTEKGKQVERVRKRKRRAVIKDTYDGYIDREIFERDGWVCWLCSNDIDSSLRHPNPMCASIDHVILLSLGGTDDRQNVRASHLYCNMRRPRK